MLVLDTNVLSELMKPQPNLQVAGWAARQSIGLMFTTSISKAEIVTGIAVMPFGRPRMTFEKAAEEIFQLFNGRVLAFDEEAVAALVQIVPARRAAGRPAGWPDLMVASIARSRDAAIVTRDIGGFELTGVVIINPWDPPT